MKGWMKGVILGIAIGTGAAEAQVYEDFDGFSDTSKRWFRHETRATTEITNGQLRISRDYSYTQERIQNVAMTLEVAAPGYFSEDGLICDGRDTFTVTGLARAPHRIGSRNRKYRIGVGFLDYSPAQIGIFVEDSVQGRRIVVRYRQSILKVVPLPNSPSQLWLNVRYNATGRIMTFWWAPFSPQIVLPDSPRIVPPKWVRVATYKVTLQGMWQGQMYLNPAVLGLIDNITCPPSWNVGMDSFSYRYVNQ